jgi:hypothetical protein
VLKNLKRLPSLKLSSEERTKFPAERWMPAIPCISGRVDVSDVAMSNPPGIAKALKSGMFKMMRVWWKEGGGGGGDVSYAPSFNASGAGSEHELFEGLFTANVSYDDERYQEAGIGSGASYGYSFWAIRSAVVGIDHDMGLGPYQAK